MIYFTDYRIDNYISMIVDKFNYSVRAIYTPMVSVKATPINSIISPPQEIIQYYRMEDYEKFRYFYLQYLESYYPLLSIVDIVLSEYYNGDVIILTDLQSDFCCNVIECISIVLNRRYGSNCMMINSIEDMNECLFNADTSSELKTNDCIQRFMNDKEWYYHQVTNAKELLDNLYNMEEYS